MERTEQDRQGCRLAVGRCDPYTNAVTLTYHIRAGTYDPNGVVPLADPVIENERFRIEADVQGLRSILSGGPSRWTSAVAGCS